MKIVVAGKGGSGKSTVSALLAKSLGMKGYRVIVIDADESNYGLHRLVGTDEPKELMDHLGGKGAIGKRLRDAMSDDHKLELLGTRWRIDDIPAECLALNGDLALMQIGKVKHFSEGCACPMGVLSREFLTHLDLHAGEVAIVDTEAGVEHIGRGIEAGSDMVLMVVDPSYESVRLSGKVTSMVKEAGKPTYIVLNKMTALEEAHLRMELDEGCIAASLPLDPSLGRAGLLGGEVDTCVDGTERLTDFIIARMGEGA